jgi:hypothetical protein
MLFLAVGAFANGSVTYTDGADKFIFAPGSKHSPTDIFGKLKNVMPGDSLTEYVKVYNARSNDVKVDIYIRSLGAAPGSEDFLSKLHMRVAKAEDNKMAYMFDAAANETDNLTEWTFLGTLYSGGEVNLEITLDVPIELGDEYQDAVGYIEWQFKAVELPVEPGDPEPPQTGDESLILFICCGAVAIVLVSIIFTSRRRRYEDE